METEQNQIRIYVACLASYNNGILHGAWIDAYQDRDQIMSAVQAILAASPTENAEEWAIHDYEGFEGISLSEYEGFERVADLASFIEEHGELGAKVYKLFGSLDDANRALDEHYCGCYESVADFAEEITSETSEVPERLTVYIDYERMASDMEISYIFVVETGYNEHHVFWIF